MAEAFTFEEATEPSKVSNISFSFEEAQPLPSAEEGPAGGGSIFKSGIAGGLRAFADIPIGIAGGFEKVVDFLVPVPKDAKGRSLFRIEAVQNKLIEEGLSKEEAIKRAPTQIDLEDKKVERRLDETVGRFFVRPSRAVKFFKEVEERERPQFDPTRKKASFLRGTAASTLDIMIRTPLFIIGGGTAKGLITQSLALRKGILSALTRRAITVGGAFGGESALRGQSLEEVAKSTLTGAAVGVAGKVPPPFRTVSEAVALIGAEKFLHGHDITPRSFMEVLAILVELKVLGRALRTPTDINKAVKIARDRKIVSEVEAGIIEESLKTPEGKAALDKAAKAMKEGVLEEAPIAEEAKRSFFEERREELKVEYEAARKEAERTEMSFEGQQSVGRMLQIVREMERNIRDEAKANPDVIGRALRDNSRDKEKAREIVDPKELNELRVERKELLQEAKEQLPFSDLERSIYGEKKAKNLKAVREELQKRLNEKLTPAEAKDLIQGRKARFDEEGKAREKVDPITEAIRSLPEELRPTLKPIATTEASPAADISPGPRWTTDPGTMPGEPAHFLDVKGEKLDTARAAIVEVLVEGTSKVLYSANLFAGRQIGMYPTIGQAARAAELVIDQVSGKAKVPPGEKGAVDLRAFLPESIVRQVEKAGQPIQNVLEGLKVLKEYRNNLEGLDKEFTEVTKFNQFYAWTLGILQIAELNPNIPGFTATRGGVTVPYVHLVRQWWNESSRFRKLADGIIREWESLGPEQAKRVGEALLDSRLLERELTPEELSSYRLSAEALLVRQKVKAAFEEFLNELERVSKEDVSRRFDGEELTIELKRIERDVNELKKKPYFPLSRYGKFAIEVINEKGKTEDFRQFKHRLPSLSDKGSVVGKAQIAKEYQKELSKKGWKIVETYIKDNLLGFNEMPPMLIERLGQQLNLGDKGMEVLRKIGYNSSPNQSFRKRMLKAKKTKGYSEDALRSFANYFFHGSSHLARLRYGTRLREAITEIEASAARLKGAGKDIVKRKQLAEFTEKHFDYIMSPKNEWAALRAYGFIHYLGFLPKAAFINLTQVPLVALPYIAGRVSESRLPRLSDAMVMVELVKAGKDVSRGMKHTKHLSAEHRRVLERALEEGVTNQSFATTLAAIMQGRFLARAMSTTKAGRFTRDILGKSSLMFSMAEGFNRRATLLATYRIFRKAGKSEEASYQEARLAVERTQFEYASWNRPRGMRGKAGANIFLFMQFLQNMLFFAARDRGNLRFLALLFAATGVQGMPFAEDIMALLDRMLSTPNKKFSSKKHLREFFLELDLNPDFMMQGGSRNSFGLSYLGDQIGIPIPGVDLNASLGMGRIISGFEPLMREGQEFSNQFTETAKGVSGAVFSLPISLWQAVRDDDPRVLKRYERAMPSFIRSPVKAYRLLQEGVTTRSRAKLATFDIGRPEDVLALSAQTIGFRTTKEAKAQEKFFAAKELVNFYAHRRQILMDGYDYALNMGDRKTQKGALDEILQYNKEVPYKGLSISTKDIRQSLKSRARTRSLQEIGISSKRSFEITQEINRVYPDEELR